MKTYYLIPVRTLPHFEIYDQAVVRLEDTPKSQAEAAAVAHERVLNNGKTQEDAWKAYRSGDFSTNPCEIWRVDVSTLSQAANWGSFSQWPCNQEGGK